MTSKLEHYEKVRKEYKTARDNIGDAVARTASMLYSHAEFCGVIQRDITSDCFKSALKNMNELQTELDTTLEQIQTVIGWLNGWLATDVESQLAFEQAQQAGADLPASEVEAMSADDVPEMKCGHTNSEDHD